MRAIGVTPSSLRSAPVVTTTADALSAGVEELYAPATSLGFSANSCASFSSGVSSSQATSPAATISSANKPPVTAARALRWLSAAHRFDQRRVVARARRRTPARTPA